MEMIYQMNYYSQQDKKQKQEMFSIITRKLI